MMRLMHGIVDQAQFPTMDLTRAGPETSLCIHSYTFRVSLAAQSSLAGAI